MKGSYTEGETTLPSGVSLPSSYGVGANYPVYNVSWYDIVGDDSNSVYYEENGVRYYADGFCYQLSKLVNGGSLGAGARLFTLPTEEEWEYAARGGNRDIPGKYAGADSITIPLDSVAWYKGNNGESGTPTYGAKEVGKLLPNELGLYDMNGNVWERCADVWKASYAESAIGSSSSRVMRGGYWGKTAGNCRVSSRDYNSTDYRIISVGFRVRCRF
jgi:formylglycine-generating enzyme required for sulfatase activity